MCTVGRQYCGGQVSEGEMVHNVASVGKGNIVQGLERNLIKRDHLEDLGVDGR
jgi:hypothetical protein